MNRLEILTEEQLEVLSVLAFVHAEIHENHLAQWIGSSIRETSEALRALQNAGLASLRKGNFWRIADDNLKQACILSMLPSFGNQAGLFQKAHGTNRLRRAGILSKIEQLHVPDKIVVFEQLVADISRQLESSVTTGLKALVTETLEQMLSFCNNEHSHGRSREDLSHFLDLVIAILGLSLYLAQNLSLSIRLFFFANEIAMRIGDMRKRIILKLSEVLLDHFTGCSSLQALPSLMETHKAIDELGDNDILGAASMFLSSLHFNLGDMKKTLRYYNEVDPTSHIWNILYYKDLSGIYPSSAAHFLGKFHLAIGIAKSACRTAQLKGLDLTEGWWCLQLTMVLGDAGCERKTVEKYLNRAKNLLNPTLHPMAYAFLLHVTACTHSRYDEIDQAYEALCAYFDFFAQCEFEQTLFGRSRNYELGVYFFRQGYAAIPSFDVELSTRKNLHGGDKMMRGAALRQKALLAYDAGASLDHVQELLLESIEVFKEAGGLIRIPQTLQLIDRLKAMNADESGPTSASGPTNTVGTARPSLILDEIVYSGADWTALHPTFGTLTRRCTKRFKKLTSHKDPSLFFRQLITIMQEEMLAERVILMECHDGEIINSLAACNISPEELKHGVCASLLPLSCQAMERQEIAKMHLDDFSAVAIPLSTHTKNTWVLYAESEETAVLLRQSIREVDENLALLIASEIRSTLLLETSRQQPSYYPSMQSESVHAPFYGASMSSLLKKANQVARTDATVLILGETGVGKELFAQHIHTESERVGAFIPVHPASMAESLIESELFGHEKGAFTGATSQKIGFFELANQGTLFIDEVGEISLSIQVKLLRVLQNQTFTRVGGTKEIRSNFRLIAATNRDLRQDVLDGKFREDLYYRLFILPFTLPPLRERSEDIMYLAQIFLNYFSKRYGKNVPFLSLQQITDLQSRHWQGNIRELKGVMERAVLLSTEHRLELFPAMHAGMHSQSNQAYMEPHMASGINSGIDLGMVLDTDSAINVKKDLAINFFESLPTLKELEAKYLAYVLERTGGKVAGPDGLEGLLKTKRSTIYAKLKRYGLI